MNALEILRGSAIALMAVLQVAAGAMLIASVGINFANIIGRYFLVGIAVLGRRGDAVSDDRLRLSRRGPGRLGGTQYPHGCGGVGFAPRLRAGFEIFSDLVTIATCIALAVFAWPVLTMLSDSTSAAIPRTSRSSSRRPPYRSAFF